MANLLNDRNFYKPFDYPWAFEAYKKQQQMHWLPDEVPLLLRGRREERVQGCAEGQHRHQEGHRLVHRARQQRGRHPAVRPGARHGPVQLLPGVRPPGSPG